MENILNKSLAALASEFRKNELAYLALTTKIEHPIRDRWAFSLYETFSGKFVVSREWKRTDLALLEQNVPRALIPRALIELKAMYTLDAVLAEGARIGKFIKAMEKDESKATVLANKFWNKNTQIYTVLLATHPKPKSIIPEDLEGVVKYRAGINNALKECRSSECVLNKAVEAIEKKFEKKRVILSGCLDGGEAFGIETDVLFWLVKAEWQKNDSADVSSLPNSDPYIMNELI